MRDVDTAKPKVWVETWGCQMNIKDSEQMLSSLYDSGYKSANSAESSDLILLNTCHIREKAKHKILSRLGRLKELKLENPNLKIVVAGCVAQAQGKTLVKEARSIDVLVGPGKIHELPELLLENAKNNVPIISLGFEKPEKMRDHHNKNNAVTDSLNGKNQTSRFVNIQQGCNNFCTFCVVPHTRGREVSKTSTVILKEVSELVKMGASEITLLGQNVNSYGLDLITKEEFANREMTPFTQLLKDTADIDGVERVRFTTSNPHDLTKDLVNLFSQQRKLGKYIHLPVQSGSNAVLEAMKRKITVEDYLEKIRWLRQAVPDMAISTDLIVGFPGETNEQFKETLELMQKVQYSFVFAFKYSPRPHTPAKRFTEQIEESVKTNRLSQLNALQDEITIKINASYESRVLKTLFLYASKKDKNCYFGRTEQYNLVKVYSDTNLIGKIFDVMITKSSKIALEGTLLN